MNKFVKIGDYLLPAEETNNIHSIYDVGRIRRVYFKPIEDKHFIDTSQTLDELLEILNEKEPSNGWIPISERLPKEKQECLVCRNGTIRMDKFIGRDIPYKWELTISDYEAWMPLPDPYKGEQE